jgi:hypothetical protein
MFVKHVIIMNTCYSHLNIWKDKNICGISSFHGGEYEEYSVMDIVPYSLVVADQCFRGAYCLHHQCD